MSHDSLGDRMKGYENAYRHSLPLRMPVIIRIDGKAFHSYTRGCAKPFDDKLINAMNEVATYLCSNISGAQLAYVQSDEISILLHNYKKLTTSAWFDNNLQKMVSVSAGMASAVMTGLSHTIFGVNKLAIFDARAYVLPESEVCNAFIWRQQDASRNSVQMVARSLYSHNQCENKNSSQLQEMIFQKGTNWNDLPTQYKRGRCIVKTKLDKEITNHRTGVSEVVQRSAWIVDNDIPVFTKDRDYINNYLKVIDDGKQEE